MRHEQKALMTHYLEGSLTTRELHQMAADDGAEARFQTEFTDDDWRDREHYGQFKQKEPS